VNAASLPAGPGGGRLLKALLVHFEVKYTFRDVIHTQTSIHRRRTIIFFLHVLCAVQAKSSAVSDPEGARKLGRASVVLSVAGVGIGIFCWIIIIALQLADVFDCSYRHHGTCYKYYKYVGHYGSCSGVRSGNFCYYN